MTVAQIRKRLAELERLEAQAAEAVKECEARCAEGRSDGMLLTEQIVAYYRGISLKKPGFVDTEEARRKLTTQLAQALLNEPFVAVPTNPTDRQPTTAHGIVFENRKHVLLLDQYRAAHDAAREARQQFAGEYAQVLREADERDAVERFREDFATATTREELAQALAQLPAVQPGSTLTSDDLA
jgi:uncharacterized membrane protein YccC